MTELDLLYLLRQVFFLTVMCVWPLFLYAACCSKRRILTFCVGLFLVGGWVLLSALMLQTNIRIWHDGSLPYVPFRVGPSAYSLRDLGSWLAYFIWLPSLLVYVLILLVLRWKRRLDLLPKFVFSLIVFFALGGLFWGWAGATVTEYAHEDTVWAKGFSFARWEKVETGMTRDQVTALLGDPIPEPIGWGYAKGEEQMQRLWWVRNWSAGYFAVVWFDKGLVHRKQFWYSD